MNPYRLLFFLTLLNLLNFVDRQLIASFANFIVPDLGLTDWQYGILTGLAFVFFYSIMGLGGGRSISALILVNAAIIRSDNCFC